MDIENVSWVMTTEQGRQFVAELLDLCGVGAYGSTNDYAQNWYGMGRRSVGEDLLRIIRRIPAESTQNDGLALEYAMLREHKRRKETEEETNG